MTKEEYVQTVVRMCNTYNPDSKKELCGECPLDGWWCDWNDVEEAYDLLTILEKWAEEHPVKTNRDKFEEVFGLHPLKEEHKRDCLSCIEDGVGICKDCTWWDAEYIEPKGEENGI